LIVGIFAVLLYEQNKPPSAANTPVRGIADASPKRVEVPPDGSRPGPEQDHQASSVPRRQEDAHTEVTALATPDPKPQDTGDKSVRETPTTRPVSRPEFANRSSHVLPRPPFTVVEPGESLVDVASRIYGSSDSTEALWKANRDQLERIDSKLTRGTLLRTP
jgi:hypothetical protein